MAKENIRIGAQANDKTGDSLRSAFQKVNNNFTELYTALGLNDTTLNLGAFEFNGSVMTTTDSSNMTIGESGTVINIAGDLVPSVANGSDLGSPSKPWNSLYVSTSTIYLGDVPLSLDAGNNLLINNIPISSAINYASIPGAPTDISDLTDDGVLLGGGGASVTESDNPPIDPAAGDLWYDTISGRLYVYYDSSWVDASPVDGAGISSTNELVNGANTLSLGSDGALTFPDTTIQSTAWTGITGFGEGFTDSLDAGKITTSKLYNENPNPGLNNQYTLEVTNGGVVVLPNGSIINGSTIRGVAGTGELNYTGITIGPNSNDAEKTWMWVDHANAYITTNNFANTWTFGNDGSLTFPQGAVISGTASSPGLLRKKYSGTFVLDPTWFAANAGNLIETSTLTGTIQNVDNPFDPYCFEYTGYFVPPTSANYTFKAHADETFIFWIGAKALSGYTFANKDMYGDYNGDFNEQQTQSFTVALAAGQFYPIRIQWGNGGGFGQLDVFTWANDVGQADTADFTDHIYTADTGTAVVSVSDNKSIVLSTDNDTTNTWTFAADGSLTFPDNTNQTTAWTGSVSSLVNGANTVSLGSDGSLTIPGDIKSNGNINIEVNLTDSTKRIWQFGEDGELTFPDGYLKIVPNGANPYISNIIDNGLGLVSGNSIQIRQSTADAYGISINSSTTDTSLGGGASLASGSNIDVNGTKIILGKYTSNYLDADTGLTGQNKIEINNDTILIGLDVSTLVDGVTTSAFDGWTFARTMGGPTLTFPDSTVQTTAYNPNSIRSEGDINIEINLADSTLRRWQFGEDGELTFPDSTVQSTAWTGIPGPYADDEAAALAGVALGSPYHKTSTGGQVFVRLTSPT
jgi:hypothetical protein